MTEVLLVSTYHMGNPGADLVNLIADDVRSPQRQEELAALSRRLGDFSPTKVLVEWHGDTQNGALSSFRDYSPQCLQEDPNEVVQLGFRLAAQQKLSDVFGIDVPGEFPFEAVQEKAAALGRLDELTALLGELQSRVQQHQHLLETHTISHYLHLLNQPENLEESAHLHMAVLALDDDDDSPGIQLALHWYERNLRIFRRLMRHTAPGDRLVVFYGAGHGYWLREMIRTTPGYSLVDPLPFLNG